MLLLIQFEVYFLIILPNIPCSSYIIVGKSNYFTINFKNLQCILPRRYPRGICMEHLIISHYAMTGHQICKLKKSINFQFFRRL